MLLISSGQVFSQNPDEKAFSLPGHDQYITVTGHVIDKHEGDTIGFGEVSVRRNNNIPVVSINENGNYSIHARPDDILVFSVIGYNRQEIAIDGRTIIDVEMDCEDCGRYFPGKGQRQAAHDFCVLATHNFNSWGYGVEYAYLPQINNPYPFFNRVIRYADLNLRVQHSLHSGSDLRIFPHIRISAPFSIPLFTSRQRLSPFVSSGYYFDTNFKEILQHDWGVGGGVKTRLAFIHLKGQDSKHLIINFTTGYTAYLGEKRKNSIYMGLTFYLSKMFVLNKTKMNK